MKISKSKMFNFWNSNFNVFSIKILGLISSFLSFFFSTFSTVQTQEIPCFFFSRKCSSSWFINRVFLNKTKVWWQTHLLNHISKATHQENAHTHKRTHTNKHPWVCLSEHEFRTAAKPALPPFGSSKLGWVEETLESFHMALTTSEVPAPRANTCDARSSASQAAEVTIKPVIHRAGQCQPLTSDCCHAHPKKQRKQPISFPDG